MKEGLEVRRGFLEEVDLRLDGDRFREKNGISGEDMENTLDFEAQRMRWFFFSFAVFVIAIFPRRKCLLISWLESPSTGILGAQENEI